MHRSFVTGAVSALTLLASSAALAAGLVEVSFKPLDQLTDVGRGRDAELGGGLERTRELIVESGLE